MNPYIVEESNRDEGPDEGLTEDQLFERELS